MVAEMPKYGIKVETGRNNGLAFYNLLDIETKLSLYNVRFINITDDVLCFFGIVHAIKWKKESKSNLQIYTTNKTAYSFVKRIEVKHEIKDSVILSHISTCINYLANNYSGDKNVLIPLELVQLDGKEEQILKSDLRKWIKEQDNMPMPEITTLRRLERDFKL